MLKVIDNYKALNHWLSREIITSKRKQEKKAAEAVADKEAKKQKAQKKTKTTTPPPIEKLLPVLYSGRKKGTTHLVKRARDLKFAAMKNTIVRGWANKEIQPNMTLKDWILRNQELFGLYKLPLIDLLSRIIYISRSAILESERSRRFAPT